MHSVSSSFTNPSTLRSFGKIRRSHKSSTRMNQVEVQGEAYICFAEDFSWFQGNINTNDESNYSIYGEQNNTITGDTISSILPITDSIPCTPQESEDEENYVGGENDDKGLEIKRCYYKATLTDHFTGLSHNLPQISLTNNSRDQHQHMRHESIFDSLEGQVDFKVVNIFKGQKADMVIKRYLGSPSLLGRKCLVYTGLMDIDFSEVIEYGRSWSL